MGYGVTAYRVELGKFSNILKSPEKDIRAHAINAAKSKHCEDLDIIKELVEEGKASNGNLGHEYFYALEGMISKIGVPMYASYWYPVEIDSYGMLEEDFQSLDSLLPFSIPEPGDFPWVLALSKNDMTTDLSNKLKAKLNDDNLSEELQKWMDEAVSNNQDLVLYLY